MNKTEQEIFWAENFGNEYIDRNNCVEQFASYLHFWSKIFKCSNNIKSVIEFGGNIGVNIRAMKTLLPFANFSVIEINKKACGELAKIEGLKIFNDSILGLVRKFILAILMRSQSVKMP
jgi:spore coat polysaccharide biosynthesis protein SpsF